jgi:transcriptional regulator with GAF, ATPase, and Fis domain
VVRHDRDDLLEERLGRRGVAANALKEVRRVHQHVCLRRRLKALHPRTVRALHVRVGDLLLEPVPHRCGMQLLPQLGTRITFAGFRHERVHRGERIFDPLLQRRFQALDTFQARLLGGECHRTRYRRLGRITGGGHSSEDTRSHVLVCWLIDWGPMKAAAGLETTLARVSLRMTSSLELPLVLDEITRGLVSDLGAAMARIWLVRPEEEGFLRLTASAGLSDRLDGSHARVPIGTRKIGQIASTRTPVYATGLLEDPLFGDKQWLEQNGLVGFAGYPLEFDDELLGVLAIFATRALAPLELEWLGIFAAQASVAIKNAELFAEVNALGQRLQAENSYLREELGEANAAGIVGRSPVLERALEAVERVAPTLSTVLLHGETGTGKELFARALHERSQRRSGPLVKVNCAALPASLIESELFGHEKGAFTGALQRRIGRFELAQGGTLLLDEVGELPLEAQAKLLRVLQEHEVERVGGTHPVRVDARIVAATNRDLEADVKAGRFRADLFFRLNVFPIALPPLRARREDIPLLASTFLEGLGKESGAPPKKLDADAALYLQAYDWPGNVRELHNVLERAAILTRAHVIAVTDLPELTPAGSPPDSVAPDPGSDLPLKDRVNGYERTLIADALRLAQNNQSEAARLLRTSRATLQYRMKLLAL